MTIGTRTDHKQIRLPDRDGQAATFYSKARPHDLTLLGHELDTPVLGIDGIVAHFVARSALQIRSRSGRNVSLTPNRVQKEYEKRRGRQNIVLKARQLGVSTWIAARFFLKTALIPGTLTVQVAHTQEAAESLFKMVHRFYRLLRRMHELPWGRRGPMFGSWFFRRLIVSIALRRPETAMQGAG